VKDLSETLESTPNNTEFEFKIPPLRTRRNNLCVLTTLLVGKSDPFVKRSLQ